MAGAFTVPLPDMPDGRQAEITDGWHLGARWHPGVDLFFRRAAADGIDPHYDPSWIVPPGWPVVAVGAGVVLDARRSTVGGIVVVRHPSFRSRYLHLETIVVTVGDEVKAGDLLGTCGWNPNTDPARGVVDGDQLRHLHFEILDESGAYTRDPAPYLAAFRRGDQPSAIGVLVLFAAAILTARFAGGGA